ncbi:MAG: DUF1987 domain-containing protein, partial [Bacteroidales bacterium]
MEKIIIQEELKNCPGIFFSPGNNNLEIVGRSIPENPEVIFRKLDEWLTGHFAVSGALNVTIRLEYINSGSSKYLYEILKKLNNMNKAGKKVVMKWMYEEDDEAMQELGEHYRD